MTILFYIPGDLDRVTDGDSQIVDDHSRYIEDEQTLRGQFPCYSLSQLGDSHDVVMGKHIVQPLNRNIESKC
jgi:hypothetical protein